MNPALLHRRRSPFSSALGSIESAPEIREVRLVQTKGHEGKVIVKDGYMPKTSFPISPGRTVSFRAKLKGVGYFWACVTVDGRKHLLFVTPASEYVEKELFLEVPLQELQFHISQSIPSNFSTRALDPASRKFLRENPDSYQTLGFIPQEPAIDVGDSSNAWNGRLPDHSWKYGYTGTQKKVSGKQTPWQPNFNGAWAGTSSLYQYTPDGWKLVAGNSNYMPVGTPLCLVGQIAAYRDTFGLGGKWYMYGTEDSQYDATKVPGRTVRLVEQKAANQAFFTSPNPYSRRVPPIEKGKRQSGGHISGWAPVLPEGRFPEESLLKYCARVEWWNPDTGEWSAPKVHPPFDLPLNEHGRFAAYFRLPRQLHENDEFYDQTPQWQWRKTRDSYPLLNLQGGTKEGEEKLLYAKIGSPKTADGGNVVVENYIATRDSPLYYPMFLPPRKNDKDKSPFHKDGRDDEEEFLFFAGSNYTIGAVDAQRFSYTDNPDILKAFWEAGQFKPGGKILLIGKAMDMMPTMWVSSKELDPDKGGTSPFMLVGAEIDENVVRDPTKYPPNSRIADRLNFTTFKSTDVTGNRQNEFKAKWAEVFPKTPCTESIISLMLRGDKLPELEGINNEKLPGFLDDDPLRYETTYEGVKFRHAYTFAFAKIPEAWYGPTLEFAEDGTPTTDLQKVWIGGANVYMYVKAEQVKLKEEIEYQRMLIAKGYTAAESAAGSDLDLPTTDITDAAYRQVQDHNNAPDSGANEKEPWWKWLGKREEVVKRPQRILFAGLGEVGTITDVTSRYSADHITSLDGLTSRNVQQYGFNDLFIVNGMGDGPTMVVTPPKEPTSSSPASINTSEHFGSSSKHALMARAQKRGNPMKYSTESSLGSIGVGFGALGEADSGDGTLLSQIADKPKIDIALGDGTAEGLKNAALIAGLALGAAVFLRPSNLAGFVTKVFDMDAARHRAREAKKRADSV